VKATRATDGRIKFDLKETLAREFDILALVFLVGEDRILRIDSCSVYLLPAADVNKWCYDEEDLAEYRLTPDRIDALFAPAPVRPVPD
jgi:hypothetical protein